VSSILLNAEQNSSPDIQITKIWYVRKDIIFPNKPVINKFRPFNTIVFATEGLGRFTAGDQELIIHEGDVHFFRSGILNKSEALNDHPRSYIFANFETLDDDVFNLPPFSPVMLLSGRPDFAKVFQALLSAYNDQGIGHMLRCRELLYRIFRTVIRNLIHNKPLSRHYDRIRPAILHIQNYYMKEIPIETLASLCNLSIRQLTRYFQEVYNKSPHEFHIEIRLRIAQDLLLNSNITISEIAEFIGYDSIYSFSRVFKQFQGLSPRNWQNLNDKKASSIMSKSVK
jgi:AraC-like DNA-binding protein